MELRVFVFKFIHNTDKNVIILFAFFFLNMATIWTEVCKGRWWFSPMKLTPFFKNFYILFFRKKKVLIFIVVVAVVDLWDFFFLKVHKLGQNFSLLASRPVLFS